MEEPLLGPQSQNPPRFTVLRAISALIRLIPGLCLCLYVCLSSSESLHPEYKEWFIWCYVLLIVVGVVELAAVMLYAKQWLKSLHPCVGMGSTCIGCILPVPLLILFIFGVQLASWDQSFPCEFTVIVCTLILLGLLLMISVLCTWKTVCLMGVSCCNICATSNETAENGQKA